MREAVNKLWPEIQWIQDAKLREQVALTWTKALERSPPETRRSQLHPVHAAGATLPGHLYGSQTLRGAHRA